MSKLLLVNLYPFYCNAVTFQRKQLRLDNLIDPVCNTMNNADITSKCYSHFPMTLKLCKSQDFEFGVIAIRFYLKWLIGLLLSIVECDQTIDDN